ncbi:TonB-dependent receptor [Sphingomonas sp. C3-2]|uniref:TonB-dependent receptor n=1 Tax=Sphingomonas sp. C3-2 TaxID=3062169 RepID=UPI00294B9355|nr:TonB-dependent receptor [Sphingomonas sp. C3-2]WOK35960.1 TonB-dependent receptor [Sphingomonas sp. C3-2]
MSKSVRVARHAAYFGASILALAAVSAQAQEADTSAPEGISDIVVTAQKRAQNLQEVPIAISAVSSEFLEQRNVTSIEQLGAIAPNVKIERGSSNSTVSSLSIRGSTTLNPALTWEPAVGLYMDGVYLGKAQGGFFDVADIERVEVLRGPQGTLYGRNTLAGAVNIIPKKPSGEWGGSAQATYGNYDYWQLRSSIDLPAFGPFSVKLSGQIAKRDGFVKLTPVGDSNDTEAGNLDSKSGMVQVRFEPTSNLTFDYAFDYSKIDQNPYYTQPYSYYPNNIFDPNSPAYSGIPYDQMVNTSSQKRGSYNTDVYERAKVMGHSLTGLLDLGAIGELKSITAHREVDFDDQLDLDGSPLPLAQSARDSNYKFFSQELQLAGTSGGLNYVFGLFYSKDKGRVLNPQKFFFFDPATPIVDSRYGFDTKTFAAYGQVDYEVTDRLTLTGGLRYTHETKGITRYVAEGGVVTIDVGKNDPRVPDAKFSNVTPTFVIGYKATDNVNVYGKYAKGFKSGGHNGETLVLSELQNPYKAETVDSFEIGLKSRLLDNRLQLNLAGFWDEKKDMQISVFTGTSATESFVLNAGKARIRGIELEAVAQPSDDLTITGSFALLDTKYKEFIEGGRDEAKNRAFIHAPKYQINLSTDWTAWRGGSWGKLNMIADVKFQDSYYNFPYALVGTSPGGQNANNTISPDRTVVDGRLVLSDLPIAGGDWSVSLWGKNLFNIQKPLTYIDFGGNFGGLTTTNFIDPRTYGVTLGVKF